MVRYLTTLSLSAVALASIIPELTVQDNALHSFDIDIKVPVELGVMSRSPDALLCENIFDHVLQWVSRKVDFTLRYVAECVTSCTGFVSCASNVEHLGLMLQNPSSGSNVFTEPKNVQETCSNFALPSMHLPAGGSSYVVKTLRGKRKLGSQHSP